MAQIGVPVINATGIPVDTSRALPVRDPVLSGGINSSVRFMFDLAFPWSYPGGSPIGRPNAADPVDAAVIYDMSERSNGAMIEPAGTVTYSGGGFDFTNCQALSTGAQRNNGIIMPASVLSDIWTSYGGNSQYYLFSAFVKLPTLANWNAAATLLSFAGDAAYTSVPSIFTMAQLSAAGGGPGIQVRRQVAAATYDTTNQLTLTPASADYGSVVQIAHWRNASGQFLRLKSANGTILITRAIGSANTQDFSANSFCVGRNGVAFGGASSTAVLSALSGFRVYRAFMENLARSLRDPVAVLDAEYAAVTARSVFT